jgi:hypothetical protein
MTTTERRRLAHRLCADLIENALSAGWSTERYLPEGVAHDDPQNVRLTQAIRDVAAKLYAIGDREEARCSSN